MVGTSWYVHLDSNSGGLLGLYPLETREKLVKFTMFFLIIRANTLASQKEGVLRGKNLDAILIPSYLKG